MSANSLQANGYKPCPIVLPIRFGLSNIFFKKILIHYRSTDPFQFHTDFCMERGNDLGKHFPCLFVKLHHSTASTVFLQKSLREHTYHSLKHFLHHVLQNSQCDILSFTMVATTFGQCGFIAVIPIIRQPVMFSVICNFKPKIHQLLANCSCQ